MLPFTVRRSPVASTLTLMKSRSSLGASAGSLTKSVFCSRLRANAQAAASRMITAVSSSAFFRVKSFITCLPVNAKRRAASLPSAFVCYAFLSNLVPQFLQVMVTLPTPRGTRRRCLHFGQVK